MQVDNFSHLLACGPIPTASNRWVRESQWQMGYSPTHEQVGAGVYFHLPPNKQYQLGIPAIMCFLSGRLGKERRRRRSEVVEAREE